MSEEQGVGLYRLPEPRRWIAGRVGDKEIYFPCSVCEAKDPEIAGYLSNGPEYKDILVVEKCNGNYLAFICTKCIERYVEVESWK